jgi:hypothetical protein
MGTYILYIIVAAIVIYSFKLVNDLDKHYNWFNSLKIGDRVKVRIFSVNCDCEAKATITSEPKVKHIQAELDKEDFNRCKSCALINGTINNGNETCWYNATVFHRGNVTKLT